MKAAVSPHDLELLSAYLDRQLKPTEQARLQARLQEEPELAAALAGLRNTRRMLRSLPRVRAPRNFTLSPAMAGVRPAQPAFLPALRLASVLAAALLVLVIAGDYLGILSPAGMQTLAVPGGAEEVAMDFSDQTAAAEAPLGMGADTGEAPQNKIAETSDGASEALALSMPPELTPAPAITDTARAEVEVVSATEEAYTTTSDIFLPPPVATLPPIPTFTPTASTPPTATPPPPPTALPIPTRTPQVLTEPWVEMQPPAAPPDRAEQALTVIEAVLAVVAIVAGLAAILLRRGPGR